MDGDERVMRYIGAGPARTHARAVEALARMIEPRAHPGYGLLHASRRDDGGFVGGCGLFPLPESDDIEIAYRLPLACWGHGYATEMASGVLEHGFATLELARIVGLTYPDNLPSQRVLRKIGMRGQAVPSTSAGGCACSAQRRRVMVRGGVGAIGLVPIDGQVLLAHVVQRDRAWLVAHGDDVLARDRRMRFFALAKRRRDGEPVAYLTGSANSGGFRCGHPRRADPAAGNRNARRTGAPWLRATARACSTSARARAPLRWRLRASVRRRTSLRPMARAPRSPSRVATRADRAVQRRVRGSGLV